MQKYIYKKQNTLKITYEKLEKKNILIKDINSLLFYIFKANFYIPFDKNFICVDFLLDKNKVIEEILSFDKKWHKFLTKFLYQNYNHLTIYEYKNIPLEDKRKIANLKKLNNYFFSNLKSLSIFSQNFIKYLYHTNNKSKLNHNYLYSSKIKFYTQILNNINTIKNENENFIIFRYIETNRINDIISKTEIKKDLIIFAKNNLLLKEIANILLKKIIKDNNENQG